MAKYTTTYDKNTDYKKLMDDAIAEGDYESAAVYEQQRNAKIGGEGITNYSQTHDWERYLPKQTAEIKLPDDYTRFSQQSKDFDGMINSLMERINSREPFSYDPETDPAYQAYKEQFTNNAQRSMQDTLAQVSARTGGLASSYAGQAAQGAYDAQMDKLNGVIPELRSLAYDMYLGDVNGDIQRLGLLTDRQAYADSAAQTALQNARADREWDYGVAQDDKAEARAEIDAILKNGGQVSSIPQGLITAAGYSPAYLAALENQYASKSGSGRGTGGNDTPEQTLNPISNALWKAIATLPEDQAASSLYEYFDRLTDSQRNILARRAGIDPQTVKLGIGNSEDTAALLGLSGLLPTQEDAEPTGLDAEIAAITDEKSAGNILAKYGSMKRPLPESAWTFNKNNDYDQFRQGAGLDSYEDYLKWFVDVTLNG